MTHRLLTSLKHIGAVVGSVVGLFSVVQAFAILPYRVNQAEKALEVANIRISSDHDILIQISRDIQYIKERLDRGNRP